MSSIVYGKNNTKKLYAKLRGWNYVVQTRACSKISFGSLKRSADYNFHLEFLILPSSGRLKPTCDILIIHFYYIYARAALAWSKKKPKKNNDHLEMRNLKQTERLKNRGEEHKMQKR